MSPSPRIPQVERIPEQMAVRLQMREMAGSKFGLRKQYSSESYSPSGVVGRLYDSTLLCLRWC